MMERMMERTKDIVRMEIRALEERIERNERIKCQFVAARLKRELAQLENELRECAEGEEI